jgi:type I restriction enzyme R subunit
LAAWRGGPSHRLSILPEAQEQLLAQSDGKPRRLKAVTELSKAFALAVPHVLGACRTDAVGLRAA